jgi:hypothetical protein
MRQKNDRVRSVAGHRELSGDEDRALLSVTGLASNPVFSTRDFRAVPAKYRTLIPKYVKDDVSSNQFLA